MNRRKILPGATNSRAAQHAAAPRNAPTRSSPRRDGGALEAPKAERAAMPWPCLLSSIAVGVASLRNLTGDTDQDNLLDAFASDLAQLHGQNNLTKQSALTEKGEMVNGRGDTPNMHDILTGSQPDGRAFRDSEIQTIRTLTATCWSRPPRTARA